ncbi:hypothetical protein [Hymenobacter sp. B81]|uniref:hypothetical protein n=1 Tax=Hymenobacter sp. B81 TaxID=3344878 RepID=UPI0037DC71CF
MRPYCYALVVLLSLPALTVRAQTPITILAADLPGPGDTLRISRAAPTLPAGAPLLSQSGPNQTWNFAALQPTAQAVEQFAALSTVPLVFQFVFGLTGGVNRANLVAPVATVLPAVPGAPAVSNANEFFNKSVADYRSVGFGATVSGTPVPVTYQSQALQDVVYRFPLTYQRRDSSNSAFVINLPGVAYLGQQQKRVNYADGWGTLTTPYGTFAALRVVTRLSAHDTVALPGNPGVGFDPPPTRLYKWLGKSQGIPLLQITTQELGGTEVITAVQYRDIYRRLVLAARPAAQRSALTVFPNPATLSAPLQLTGLPNTAEVALRATDLAGRALFAGRLPVRHGTAELPAAALGSFRGVLLLTVHTPQGTLVQRVVRQ